MLLYSYNEHSWNPEWVTKKNCEISIFTYDETEHKSLMRERASSAWMIHILRSIQKEGMDIMFSQDKILVLWCRSHFPKWTLKVFRYNVNGFTFPYPIRRSSSVRLEGNHDMCASVGVVSTGKPVAEVLEGEPRPVAPGSPPVWKGASPWV